MQRARRARGSGFALCMVVAACSGHVAEQRPDAERIVSNDAPGGGSGLDAAAPDSSAGGSGGFVDEPWDATVDGIPATPDQLCQMEGIALPSPCTPDELSFRLSRRWWQCSGDFAFDTPDAVGVEFTNDGHWYLLVTDPGGAVNRAGASSGGTWKMTDTSSVNGPCSIQLDIQKSGTVYSFPVFEKQPTKVNLNTGGDAGAPVYVALP